MLPHRITIICPHLLSYCLHNLLKSFSRIGTVVWCKLRLFASFGHELCIFRQICRTSVYSFHHMWSLVIASSGLSAQRFPDLYLQLTLMFISSYFKMQKIKLNQQAFERGIFWENILTGEINHGFGWRHRAGIRHCYVPKTVGRLPFHLHKHPSVFSDRYTVHVKW